MYLNRTVCDVLEAMRKAYETRNFAPLLGYIEEAQDMVNRMEAKLYTIKDHDRLKRQVKKLRKQRDSLEEKLELEMEE